MQHSKSAVIAGALLLGIVATQAEALVIYNWYDVAANPNVGLINASIAFDENIWELDETFVYNSRPAGEPLPFFGVGSIDFGVSANLNSTPPVNQGFTDPIQLRSSPCGQSPRHGLSPAAYCAGLGLAVDDVVVSPGYWNFNVKFGEYLTGSMYLNDFSTSVQMASHDTLFTISSLGSDSPGPCFHPANCFGGTGYWKLLTVNEPGTVVLLALGLIPLAALRAGLHRMRAAQRNCAITARIAASCCSMRAVS